MATGSNIDYDAIGQEKEAVLCVLYLIPLQKEMRQKEEQKVK